MMLAFHVIEGIIRALFTPLWIVVYFAARTSYKPCVQRNGKHIGGPYDRSFSQMYKPNFCAECGEQIIRARWRVWTSRRFCSGCAGRLRKTRLVVPLVVSTTLFTLGLLTGRSARQASPPLVITQGQGQGLPATIKSPERQAGNGPRSESTYGPDGTASERPTDPNEIISICGARTKKGTPCSRRVRGTGRCWQHKGMPAILPPEKLSVSGN